ncbi:MAG: hypothetical protein ABIN10_06540 [Specibacter sp.]
MAYAPTVICRSSTAGLSSAPTILHNHPSADQPCPEDADSTDFAHFVLDTAGRWGDKNRKRVDVLLQSMDHLVSKNLFPAIHVACLATYT